MKSIASSFLSLIAAFAVTGGIVWFIGENPLKVYGILFNSAFGSGTSIGYTIFYTTPLIFTGLAVAIALHAGLFSIGCEGQLHIGAFAATLIGLSAPTVSSYPFFWQVLALSAAFLGGAMWGIIPGILKAYRGSHEVITTIMLNMIAFALLSYLTLYHFRDPTTQAIETREISSAVYFSGLYHFLPLPEASPANTSFFLALLVAGLMYIYLWKTPQGYEFRVVGISNQAAQYAHVPIKKYLVLAMGLSGGIAGLVATNDILGYAHRFKDGFSPGYGYLGIAVALLGKNHPIGIIFAALLFGALHNSSIALDLDTEKVSRDLVGVLEGIIILFVACEIYFHHLWKFFKQSMVKA